MKPARARDLVEYLRTSYRISIRRACGALRFDRSTYHYRHRRPEQASLRKRIHELAESRVRYGYRRIHILLRREGWGVNHKRTRRLYREEGLQLRRKTPKRKVSAKQRQDRVIATAANECWSMDFLSDQSVRRPQDPRSDHRRQLYPDLAGDRCAAELSRRRCGGHVGADRDDPWPPEMHPGG